MLPANLLETLDINPDVAEKCRDEQEKFRILRDLLIERIRHLIHHDIEKLRWILYRVDVDEKKLSNVLHQTDQDVATAIADLILARQIEKFEHRRKDTAQHSDWDFDV
ncbi:MAG: hypothetical protein NZM35_09270 [Chitinophagales bacterium]|nr:hypothetical protein [Chitinophagales bacterium]MDW8419422.1 hypothetical protein [Chitinophagales bacterium]